MAKEIPDDVAFMILSKLPLKSLKRFTCVHKSWAQLLENPNFLSNFLCKHHSYYHDTSLDLLVKTHWTPGTPPNTLYLLSGDKFEKGVKFVCSTPLFQANDMQMTIFGHSIHGVFCLHGHINAALWNPATEEFRILPPSPEEYRPNWYRRYFDVSLDPHGFGYDPVRDDFKVIRILRHWQPSNYRDAQDEPMPDPIPYTGPFWEIYSLRSNSWRKLYMPIVDDIPDTQCDHAVYMNGVCHWFGLVHDYRHETHCLASFNLSNENFIVTHLPLDLDHRWMTKCLVVLNESIAVISKDVETTTFHISIMGELGVKESWTKLFSVGTLPGVAFPIGVGKKGHIFFKKENGQLAFFDLSTQMLEDIVTEGESHGDMIRIYKENLLPIGTTEY